MGNIKTNRSNKPSAKKKDLLASANIETGGSFVLCDVSKEELEKRRIPVYPILL